MILDVFERKVQKIRTSGDGQYKGLCPFHDDRKPSFTFNDEGLFFCFGCQVKGNANQFAEMVGETIAVDMPVIIPKVRSWSPPGPLDSSYQERVFAAHETLLLDPARYIGDLPWNLHIVKKLTIGWEDGLVFPYLNSNGDLVNIKWHKKRQVKGHAQTFIFPFWHMIHRYKQDKVLYVVEGEKDCVSMISKGNQAISFNNGAATKIPRELVSIFRDRFDDIVIYFDEDDAGRKATVNFLESYG